MKDKSGSGEIVSSIISSLSSTLLTNPISSPSNHHHHPSSGGRTTRSSTPSTSGTSTTSGCSSAASCNSSFVLSPLSSCSSSSFSSGLSDNKVEESRESSTTPGRPNTGQPLVHFSGGGEGAHEDGSDSSLPRLTTSLPSKLQSGPPLPLPTIREPPTQPLSNNHCPVTGALKPVRLKNYSTGVAELYDTLHTKQFIPSHHVTVSLPFPIYTYNLQLSFAFTLLFLASCIKCFILVQRHTCLV